MLLPTVVFSANMQLQFCLLFFVFSAAVCSSHRGRYQAQEQERRGGGQITMSALMNSTNNELFQMK